MNHQRVSKELLEFIFACEKLKTELRHSWTSDSSRQESVAEHSWMLGMMAMMVFEHISFEVDQLRVMKMVALHDVTEVIVGDIPAHERSQRKRDKQELENKAIESLAGRVSGTFKAELLELWREYDARETNEAKLASALDKLEVLIQHYLADMDTWSEGDYRIGMLSFKDEYFNIDEFLRAIRDEVNRLNWEKLKTYNMLGELQASERALGESLFEVNDTTGYSS